MIHPELLNSTLGKYVVHLENKLKEQGIAQCSYNINKAIIMIGSSNYISIGYTKIRVTKSVPLFFNKR